MIWYAFLIRMKSLSMCMCMMHHADWALVMCVSKHEASRVRWTQSKGATNVCRCRNWSNWCGWHHAWWYHCGYGICMNSIMCAQTKSCCKHFMTFSTFVHFMCCSIIHQMQFLLMCNHITIPCKWFATNITVMILYASMRWHMPR